MIIENKPQKQITHYGRMSLANTTRIKSLVTRDSDLNPIGRETLRGSKQLHSELLIQVLPSPYRIDIAPQIFLIEVTDTGLTRKQLGRFSIKNQKIQDRAIWQNLEQSTIDTLARYYPKLDILESLSKLLPYAVGLLDSMPRSPNLERRKISKQARSISREYGILTYVDKPRDISKPVLQQKSRKVDHSELVGLIPTEKILESVSSRYGLMTVDNIPYQASRVHIPSKDTRKGRF